jgi:hypothetical protein
MGLHRSRREGGGFGEVEQSYFFLPCSTTAVERWISSLRVPVLLLCVEFKIYITIIPKAIGMFDGGHY